jgi:hypothetical protein
VPFAYARTGRSFLMASELLFVYTDPGPVPEAEFHDWYDNEHGPVRLTVPGFRNGFRFHALDDMAPPWLAMYDLDPGTLDSPEYKALAAGASARERSVTSRLASFDRRVYSQLSEAGEPFDGPPPVVLAVALSVPQELEGDLDAWYAEEHIPMLLEVPGWQRIRRFRLTRGTGPDFLSLHEVAGQEVFDAPGYRAAVTTPWRDSIVGAAIGRERRLFGFRNAFMMG